MQRWKCEGARDDEVKEAFYTFWLLAAEFWQRQSKQCDYLEQMKESRVKTAVGITSRR